ncbi:MAG: hypothetical protein U1E89_09845 [Burkholderiaceae bacterium]
MNHPKTQRSSKLALWLTCTLSDGPAGVRPTEWHRRLAGYLYARGLVLVIRGQECIIFALKRELDANDRRELTAWLFAQPGLALAAIEIRPLSDLAAKPAGSVARITDAANDPWFGPYRRRD